MAEKDHKNFTYPTGPVPPDIITFSDCENFENNDIMLTDFNISPDDVIFKFTDSNGTDKPVRKKHSRRKN